jgi:hypothetical protein
MLTPPAIVSMLAGSFFAEHFSVSTVLFSAGVLALMSLLVILGFGKNIANSL